MTDIVNLPRQNSAVTESGQPMSREWYNFFRRLADNVSGLSSSVTTISNTTNNTLIGIGNVEKTIIDATTARTLSSGDANSLIEFTNSAAITVTVTANSLNTDDVVYLKQSNTGQITVAAGAGVTIETSDSLKTRTQESTIGLKQTGVNEWTLFGDIEPVAPARSALIRSANSTGVPAWTSPTADGQVLKRSSGTLVFGALTLSETPDYWTYIKLGSDFTTSSATAVDITGLAFTPAASTTYEIEAQLLCRTATTTVGVRHGVAWPTGMTDGVAYLEMTSAAGTTVLQNGNINAAVLAPVGGLPDTTSSWPAQVKATLIAGGSPSGTLKLQVASETGGTTVTVKAGSWLKYRAI